MTIQSVTSVDPYSSSAAPAQKPASQPAQQVTDTVHLSPQAKASLDVDHDGDSH